MRRRAVRNLHAGNDSGLRVSAGAKGRAYDGRNARGAFGESLPLYWLSSNFRSGSGSRSARREDIKPHMRSDPAEYELVAPASLHAAVSLLAEQPKAWLPIAGGTDVMVQFAMGTLAARKLLSIWDLLELRGVEILPHEVAIGACCTYSDLRKHGIIAREFPSLARAASWTGGIANQNRGTLGGNIANASPAADSLPALLTYDAELLLTSVRGERRVAYRGFHLGYKKTAMAADELIRAIYLPRKFSEYFSHARKVGARQAQAIAKVAVAGLGLVVDGVMRDVR